jgi:hypothetical protein
MSLFLTLLLGSRTLCVLDLCIAGETESLISLEKIGFSKTYL